MKSLKYLAIAVAVAGVAMTATPADAGSVGAKGGQTQKTTVVDKVTDDVKHKDNVTDKRVDITKENVTTTKTSENKYNDTTRNGKTYYQINVYAENTGDWYNGNKGWSVHQGSTGVYDSLSGARGAAIGIMANTVNKSPCAANGWIGRKGVTQYGTGGAYESTFNGYASIRNGSATWAIIKNSGAGGGSTSNYGSARKVSETKTSKTTTGAKKLVSSSGPVKTGDTTVETSQKKEKTGETWAFKGQTYKFSDDAIIVGDTDGGNVYAAQGSMTIENHYDRTDHYLVTHNKTHTETYTTTNNYTQNQHTVNTYNRVYEQDHIYKASMGMAISPIILDLDGDGKIEASNGKYLPHQPLSDCAHYAMFDFYGNGFPLMMEWVGANDGLLCRPDADGTVKGTNLFGTANGYDNGYDELASLDINKDGQISGEELEGLMVWQDANSNGIADKGELKSLESLGVTSISANHKNFSSSFTRNGQTYKTFDWWPNGVKMDKINIAH